METDKGKSKGSNKSSTRSSSKHSLSYRKRLIPIPSSISNDEKKTKWKVQSHLGSGGFGDVYQVVEEKDSKTSETFAMKTELHTAKLRRLMIEREILRELSTFNGDKKKSEHFCKLVDSGNTIAFAWIVMTLIGPSLDEIRRAMKIQYKQVTVIKIGFETLEALEYMHEVGFIHRDLKPANICIGNPPKEENILYLLDFGISRRIYKSAKNRTLRNERAKVPFFGTRKFCSRACHEERDQGRKDDTESWIYTLLDLFSQTKGLPWCKGIGDKKEVVRLKNELFKNPANLWCENVPKQFMEVIEYIGTLKFADPVDYEKIRAVLKKIAKKNKLELSEDFEWIGKVEDLVKKKKQSSSGSIVESCEQIKDSKEMPKTMSADDTFVAMLLRQKMEKQKKYEKLHRSQSDTGTGIEGVPSKPSLKRFESYKQQKSSM